MNALVVTTSGKTRGSGADDAIRVAARLGVPFIACTKGRPVERLLDDAEAVLVLRGDGVVLLDATGSSRWTPGMADLRIHRLDAGIQHPDHVLLSGEVRAGDCVLDCTLGRGHDALVLERAVGPTGRVRGVEASLPLFAWTSEGLARHGSKISCVHDEARTVLRSAASGSFDVVFFDPMFDRRAQHEAGFSPVRRHAGGETVDASLLAEARRVARRWVVVKAAPQSGSLRRLGLETVPFKRNAELRFGRISGSCPPG